MEYDTIVVTLSRISFMNFEITLTCPPVRFQLVPTGTDAECSSERVDTLVGTAQQVFLFTALVNVSAADAIVCYLCAWHAFARTDITALHVGTVPLAWAVTVTRQAFVCI